MTGAKTILRCSSITSNTVLRAELGMHPLKRNRDNIYIYMRKLKWQHIVRNIPAIVDGAVWEKVTKGQAEIGWDGGVEKVWNFRKI